MMLFIVHDRNDVIHCPWSYNNTCVYGQLEKLDCLDWFTVFNATFNNMSVISSWSVLSVEETGVPGENHRPVASHLQTLSHAVSSTPRLFSGDMHWLLN
jgi:hypothetical protein